MRLTTKNFLWMFLIIIVILSNLVFVQNILIPSHESYKIICEPKNFNSNYCITGIYYLNDSTIEIKSEPHTTEYNRTLRHESTHHKQSLRKGLFKTYNCANKFG